MLPLPAGTTKLRVAIFGAILEFKFVNVLANSVKLSDILGVTSELLVILVLPVSVFAGSVQLSGVVIVQCKYFNVSALGL